MGGGAISPYFFLVNRHSFINTYFREVTGIMNLKIENS